MAAVCNQFLKVKNKNDFQPLRNVFLEISCYRIIQNFTRYQIICISRNTYNSNNTNTSEV